MKRIISTLIFIVACSQSVHAQEAVKGWIQVSTTNSVPQIIGTNTVAKTFVFTGVTTGWTNNTSRVWVQQHPTINTGGFCVMPGQMVSVTVDTSRARRWNFYIHAETTGDGLSVELLQ